MAKERIVLKWSKKDKSWMFHYPDLAGKSLMTFFFEMLKFENLSFNKPSVINPDYIPESLKDALTTRGYDYTTLKITVDKIKQSEEKA